MSGGSVLSKRSVSPVLGCEAEQLCVERLPPKRGQCEPWPRLASGHLGAECGAINSIAQKRMTAMGQMHTELMRAARFQLAADKARLRISLDHRVMRDRITADFVGDDSDFLAVVT